MAIEITKIVTATGEMKLKNDVDFTDLIVGYDDKGISLNVFDEKFTIEIDLLISTDEAVELVEILRQMINLARENKKPSGVIRSGHEQDSHIF